METYPTTGLSASQPVCWSDACKTFVASAAMSPMPEDPALAGLWTRRQRLALGWSGEDLASRINGRAQEDGDPTRVSQQVVSKFEKGVNKRMPAWARLLPKVFEESDEETDKDPYLSGGRTDDGIKIKLLPTFAGLGAGGTGEGDVGEVTFSRDLIENELRVPPDALLAMVADGNSMEPDFKGGDQILVDTRRTSLAQPGAFCLWDGDGHVVKYLERIPESDPPRVSVVSANQALYPPRTRLLDEIRVVGRVIWFGRRVQ
jgi:phage repressor protein C with HTH and peptisase S24 domain